MAKEQKPVVGIGTTLEASGNKLKVTGITKDGVEATLVETGTKVKISRKDVETAISQK